MMRRSFSSSRVFGEPQQDWPRALRGSTCSPEAIRHILVGSKISQYPDDSSVKNDKIALPTERAAGINCTSSKLKNRFPLVTSAVLAAIRRTKIGIGSGAICPSPSICDDVHAILDCSTDSGEHRTTCANVA